MIDLYDSDILVLEQVMDTLRARSTGRRDMESFNKEIKERFIEAGFLVTVNWFTAADPDGHQVADTYIPEITIDERLHTGEFDRDRMVHEVTNDLLELGEGGVIKTTGIDPAQRAAMDAHKSHRH